MWFVESLLIKLCDSRVHGVTKSQTQLSDFTFTFYFHALEKEMATHSSVLAWRIPETGEPDGVPQSWTRLKQQQQQQVYSQEVISLTLYISMLK